MSRRVWGTGHLYEKHGSYYARWRTTDGRLLNRKVGPLRAAGARDGLTRSEAEKEFRHMQAAEEQAPPRNRSAPAPTFGEVSVALRRQLQLRGSRPSYLENCESMDRIHISPVVWTMPVADIGPADIEAVAQPMLSNGLSPKTVRNVVTYVYSVFEYAIERGLVSANPVRHVTRPGRRRQGDVRPDLRFLTVEELEAVIRAIPDQVVVREPAQTRKGRPGPAPPPPPDVLGPVLRVLVLTAAMTGLRQSELLGLRWRDVDWNVQRIRVRNAFVRGQHSTDGKSDLSTRRSVPMADRIAGELDRWSRRSSYSADEDLVFAHPETGNPLDRSKVTKRFKAACRAAGVPPIRFHDLRHTFGTRMAASGQPIRSIQEFLGHADVKTTQIYMHYAPSEREVAMVNEAFAPTGNKAGNKLSETDSNPGTEIPADMGASD
jgi:integrase